MTHCTNTSEITIYTYWHCLVIILDSRSTNLCLYNNLSENECIHLNQSDCCLWHPESVLNTKQTNKLEHSLNIQQTILVSIYPLGKCIHCPFFYRFLTYGLTILGSQINVLDCMYTTFFSCPSPISIALINIIIQQDFYLIYWIVFSVLGKSDFNISYIKVWNFHHLYKTEK